MNNKRTAMFFAVFAALVAAGTAPIDANSSSPRGLVVAPLILVAFLLCAAGYYAGLSRNQP